MSLDEQPIEIATDRGTVEARFTPPAPDAAPSDRAVLMVGGGDGGFDGPAEALYPALAEDFAAQGIATLRLDFRLHRFPNDVAQGAHDIAAGRAWLTERALSRIVLIGHSFGGAVVIEAGRQSSFVVGVVTLATQTAGAEGVGLLAPRALLLIHGRADTRLSPVLSQMLYDAAGDPKELVLIEGATHSLRQAREEVRERVLTWTVATLNAR